MKLSMTYSVKIKRLNHIFMDTVHLYRQAVFFFIKNLIRSWNNLQIISIS